MKKIRIITRNSQLAIIQAQIVKQELIKHYPALEVEIIGITTKGDKILDKALDKIGGKGLFIKELEIALLNNQADIAVHSLKDLPVELSSEFTLSAILSREDPSDCFIANKYDNIEQMPQASVIGTSSARRAHLLKLYYPQLTIKLLRGNLTTRLKKLDNFEYDAIILATCGIKRLGLTSRIKHTFAIDKFIPAIGQGALAIETLANNQQVQAVVAKLNDQDTAFCTNVERQIGLKLNASCSVAIGVYARQAQNKIQVDAFINNNTSNRVLNSIDEIDLCVQDLNVPSLCPTK